MKGARRSILHVDLDPFFVAVERSLDPTLAGRPLVIGATGRSSGAVAAASVEARTFGVRPGQAMRTARDLCPDAEFRAGDLEAYGHVSERITTLLLGVSRRIERPSADEAYADLTPEGGGAPPTSTIESLREEIQRRLGLDAAFGLASSRLAARVASSWARPRGLLVVLPGYESSFLASQSVTFLDEFEPRLLLALEGAGLTTFGAVAAADETMLAALVGPTRAQRLRARARGEVDDEIAVAAPPTSIVEESAIRDRRSDVTTLLAIVDGLARRAARRLRPFGLQARAVSVEVRRADGTLKRTESIEPGLGDDDTAASVARVLSAPLFAPSEGVRSLLVRLGRLAPPARQASLFPDLPFASGHSG